MNSNHRVRDCRMIPKNNNILTQANEQEKIKEINGGLTSQTIKVALWGLLVTGITLGASIAYKKSKSESPTNQQQQLSDTTKPENTNQIIKTLDN